MAGRRKERDSSFLTFALLAAAVAAWSCAAAPLPLEISQGEEWESVALSPNISRSFHLSSAEMGGLRLRQQQEMALTEEVARLEALSTQQRRMGDLALSDETLNQAEQQSAYLSSLLAEYKAFVYVGSSKFEQIECVSANESSPTLDRLTYVADTELSYMHTSSPSVENDGGGDATDQPLSNTYATEQTAPMSYRILEDVDLSEVDLFTRTHHSLLQLRSNIEEMERTLLLLALKKEALGPEPDLGGQIWLLEREVNLSLAIKQEQLAQVEAEVELLSKNHTHEFNFSRRRDSPLCDVTMARLTPAGRGAAGAIWSNDLLPLGDGFNTSISFQIVERGMHCRIQTTLSSGKIRGRNEVVHSNVCGEGGGDGLALIFAGPSSARFVPSGPAVDNASIGVRDMENALGVFFRSNEEEEEGGRGRRNSVSIRGSTSSSGLMRGFDGDMARRFNVANFSDGNIHRAWVTFSVGAEAMTGGVGNGEAARFTLPGVRHGVSRERLGSLKVYLDDPTQAVLSIPVSLSHLLALDKGMYGRVGISASTSFDWQQHDILSWDFNSTSSACVGQVDDSSYSCSPLDI